MKAFLLSVNNQFFQPEESVLQPKEQARQGKEYFRTTSRPGSAPGRNVRKIGQFGHIVSQIHGIFQSCFQHFCSFCCFVAMHPSFRYDQDRLVISSTIDREDDRHGA
jgi:hypothetical protein